jgi:hypothetical protein
MCLKMYKGFQCTTAKSNKIQTIKMSNTEENECISAHISYTRLWYTKATLPNMLWCFVLTEDTSNCGELAELAFPAL